MTVARRLCATKRQLNLGPDRAGVDIQDARVDVLHGPESTIHIACVDRGRQTILHAVDDIYRFFNRIDRDNRRHRTEYLLLSDPHVRLHVHPLIELFNSDFKHVVAAEGLLVTTEVNEFRSTRYRNAIAFEVSLRFFSPPEFRRGSITQAVDQSFGPIAFLPDVGLSTDETVAIILQDLVKLEMTAAEPDWLHELSPPGQTEVDHELASVGQQLATLETLKAELEDDRVTTRQVLRLLVEQGDALENITRQVLRSLGATVHDPEARDEDGWLEIVIDSEPSYGVLEVKGTNSNQHDMKGLRQLNDWKDKLDAEHGRDFKRLFFGNNAIRQSPVNRPNPFAVNWLNRAVENKGCAMTTAMLYQAYVLDHEGALDREAIWRALFSTSGVFDDEYLDGARNTAES